MRPTAIMGVGEYVLGGIRSMALIFGLGSKVLKCRICEKFSTLEIELMVLGRYLTFWDLDP